MSNPTRPVRGEIPTWRTAEITRLLESVSEPRRTEFHLAVLTGVRVVDQRSLKWSDIDFSGAKVTKPAPSQSGASSD
jgi:integrase